MTKIIPLLLLLALGMAGGSSARAQDSFAGIDLLYPEFAHPERDAQAAIKERDYRFITTDRQRKVVPGLGEHRGLRWKYKTKFIRQRLRLFPTRSQNFSYNLRARAYATEYNQTLLQFLLELEKKKKDERRKR